MDEIAYKYETLCSFKSVSRSMYLYYNAECQRLSSLIMELKNVPYHFFEPIALANYLNRYTKELEVAMCKRQRYLNHFLAADNAIQNLCPYNYLQEIFN